MEYHVDEMVFAMASAFVFNESDLDAVIGPAVDATTPKEQKALLASMTGLVSDVIWLLAEASDKSSERVLSELGTWYARKRVPQ